MSNAHPEKTARLIVLGSLNADIFVELDRLPLPGETLLGGDTTVKPGGKGANQAAAAARLGARTWMAGQVGEDGHADFLRSALSETGADCSLIQAVPGATGQAFIFLQKGGENSIVLVGGANRAWTGPTKEMLSTLAGADMLLLQREVPECVNIAAARAARRANVPVLLDAGGDQDPISEELLSSVDILSPNETELAHLTGLPTGSEEQIRLAGEDLLRRGVREVLVKCGNRGSLLIRQDGPILRQAIMPAVVVDTTGAGDCFTGAFAVARAEGRNDQEALRFATAAAALSVSRKGAMPSMPLRADVIRSLRA